MSRKKAMDRLKLGLGTLRPVRLHEAENWGLSEGDLEGTLVEHRGPALLFGSFPASKVLGDLQARGILDTLRTRGYRNFEFRSESESAFESRIRLYGSHPSVEEPCVLMDVRTHRGELSGASPCLGRPLHVRSLIWEWLSFQDPLAPFPPGVQALPGQEHPGLGIFRPSVQLMLDYVAEMDIDALVGLPQYFHNAVLYGTRFRFFLPALEGDFRALRRDLLAEGLPRASRALAEGRVLEVGSGRRVTWQPAEQVYPVQGEICDHFKHPAWLQEVEQALRASRYRIVDEA